MNVGPGVDVESPSYDAGCGKTSALLEAMRSPAVILSREHRILLANRAYRDRYNGGGEVLGRQCFEVSHGLAAPCDEMGLSCSLRRARDTGERARALHTHRTSDGDHQEWTWIYPLFSQSGELDAFLEILTPARLGADNDRTRRLVGRSDSFNAMLELVSRVAPTQTTVLLLGETGTGKELVARAVHRGSARRGGPFVPVDCSGLTETLFESELFGHERGAFTGATQSKRGLVEAADGGTLFLDEVGDIPLALQVKLLRLLESGVFRRVGSTREIHSDFRLICATHQDLRRMTEEGSFRTDLYYRISAFPITLPSLRERRGDIPVLVQTLLARLGCSRLTRVDPEAMAALEAYDFPGNVRELNNVLERACLLAEGDTLRLEHLPRDLRCADADETLLPHDTVVPLHEMESRYLKWVSSHFEGERAEMARRLGLSERTLYRKLHSVRGEDG